MNKQLLAMKEQLISTPAPEEVSERFIYVFKQTGKTKKQILQHREAARRYREKKRNE